MITRRRQAEISKVSEQPNTVTEIMATKIEIEDLLRKHKQRTTKLNEPVIFNGRVSENPREWMNNFESYCKLNNIENEERILTFSLLIRAGAKNWFNNLKPDDRSNWETIKDKFKIAYLDANKWINTQRIENRRLQNNESCEKYITDVTDLALLVGMSDNELQKTLIRGLPHKLKWHVVSFNPMTIEETVQRILLGEATLQCDEKDEIHGVESTDGRIVQLLDNINIRIDNLEKKLERQTPQEENRPVMFCDICKKTNHTTMRCYFRNPVKSRYVGNYQNKGGYYHQYEPRQYQSYGYKHYQPNYQNQSKN